MNLKTGVSRNKTRQIFRKTNISYPLIRTHNLFSWNILAFLPCYQRFDVWLTSIHSAWHYRISLFFEFLTVERDWKFLLIRMFNKRKCSLDIVGIYSQKHIPNPTCQILSKMEFLLKIVIFENPLTIFAKDFTLRCLTEFRMRHWFDANVYYKIGKCFKLVFRALLLFHRPLIIKTHKMVVILLSALCDTFLLIY